MAHEVKGGRGYSFGPKPLSEQLKSSPAGVSGAVQYQHVWRAARRYGITDEGVGFKIYLNQSLKSGFIHLKKAHNYEYTQHGEGQRQFCRHTQGQPQGGTDSGQPGCLQIRAIG